MVPGTIFLLFLIIIGIGSTLAIIRPIGDQFNSEYGGKPRSSMFFGSINKLRPSAAIILSHPLPPPSKGSTFWRPNVILRDPQPPSIAPPPELNSQANPVMAVAAFSNEAVIGPRAVDFGFLPVFPWPKRAMQQVNHLFPSKGANEIWPAPRVDDHLSVFPHDRPRPPPFVMPEYIPPSPSTTTMSTLTRAVAKTRQNNEKIETKNSNEKGRKAEFTTRQTSSTTTTTPAPITSTIAPRRSTTQPRTKWNSRVNEAVQWPRAVPAREKDLDAGERRRRVVPVSPTTPRPSPVKQAITKRRKELNHLEIIRNYKPSNCRPLNPFVDSLPHPNTDRTCEQGLPGWRRRNDCKCTFLVASRNFVGCPTKFHTLCWRK